VVIEPLLLKQKGEHSYGGDDPQDEQHHRQLDNRETNLARFPKYPSHFNTPPLLSPNVSYKGFVYLFLTVKGIQFSFLYLFCRPEGCHSHSGYMHGNEQLHD